MQERYFTVLTEIYNFSKVLHNFFLIPYSTILGRSNFLKDSNMHQRQVNIRYKFIYNSVYQNFNINTQTNCARLYYIACSINSEMMKYCLFVDINDFKAL